MDILADSRFITIESINRGWSDDKKYCVTKDDGTKIVEFISFKVGLTVMI